MDDDRILEDPRWLGRPDGELIRAYQRGADAESAFRSLYARTARPLWAFLARKGLVRAEIESVLQETWLRALRILPAYEDRGVPFVSWLCGTAVRVWHEYLREQGEAEPLPDGYDVVDELSHEPLAQLVEREERDTLRAALGEAIAQLKPDQRAVLERREVLRKSSREVADELGWTISKVDTTLHRAKAACRATLLARFGAAVPPGG